MRRKTFDAILTAGGVVLTVVLLVAGGLLMWAHNFTDHNVRTQLGQQQIFFPDKGSKALTADPEITKYVTPYAGQQVLAGAQAEVFADHYIGVHLKEIGGGQTYSQLSAKSMAEPSNTKLAGQVQTLFRGETLRGLLLNAYAFGKMGQIAFVSAIASFAGAGLMLVLSILGLLHLRRVSPDAEVWPANHTEKVLA